MWQATSLGILILCASALADASANLETPTYSRNFTITNPNSHTVPFNGHLYTVSKNQSHIHVNSSDVDVEPCDIAIDAARDSTQGRLEVTSTEREIFVVGVRSIGDGDRYKYTILRVDPEKCTYESANIDETNDSRGGYFFPRLVRHQTGTDVFFPSLQNCAPCRLNSVGLKSRGSTPQLPRETSPAGVPFHVRYVNSANAYFYVYNSHNFSSSVKTTTLKLLDKKDFGPKKERIVDFPVYAVSKQKENTGHLGVCTKKYDNFMADISAYTEVRCERLNPNLDTTKTITIPIKPHSEPISSISYEFDKEANSYISYAEDTKLRLYIHNTDGKLVKAIDMGEIDGGFQRYPDYNPEEFDAYEFWDVNGFLVGDEYCIVTGQVTTGYTTPLEQVRCVNVKEYVKH